MADIRAQFGAVLKAWRTRRRLTQEELAERSGLSYKFIGEIERGKGNPSLETLGKLALALGVEIPQLFLVPSRVAGPDALYQIRTRDFQSLREALDSAGAVLNRLGPSHRVVRRKSR